MANKGKTNLAQ